MRRLVAAALVLGLLMVPLPVFADIAGIGTGVDWAVVNGGGTAPLFDGAGGVQITEDANDTYNAIWWNQVGNVQQAVDIFSAQFDYQVLTGSGTPADGAGLVLQNYVDGIASIGGGGGSLAYEGIGDSAGVFVNIYSGGAGTGLRLGEDGTLSGTSYDTSPVDFIDPGNWPNDYMRVKIDYNVYTQLLNIDLEQRDAADINNVLATKSFTFSGIDIPTLVGGSTAYVGFTGATGGENADQNITNFSYTEASVPVLSWDGTATGDWTDAHWLGGPPTYPTATEAAVVSGSLGAGAGHGVVINVTGNQEALGLDLQDSGPAGSLGTNVVVGVGAKLTVGGRILDHDAGVATGFNYFTLQDQAELSTGTGSSTLGHLWYLGDGTDAATITTPGDAVILNEISDESDPYDPLRTLTKRGAGTLTFQAPIQYTQNTVFRVEEGTLKVLSESPLGPDRPDGSGGFLVKDIELAGGTFHVGPAPIPNVGLWVAYLSGDQHDYVAYPHPMTEVSEDLHETEAMNVADDYTLAFSGYMYTGDTAGTWQFTENFDDQSWIWVNGTQVISNTSWDYRSYGSIDLPAATWVPIEMRYVEGGGGDGPPADGEPNFAYLAPGDDTWRHPWSGANLDSGWYGGDLPNLGLGNKYIFGTTPHLLPGTFEQPYMNVVVDAAGSTLYVDNVVDTEIAKLTLNEGVVTVTGAGGQVSFGEVEVPSGVAAGTVVGVNTLVPTVIGPVNANGETITFVKDGTGGIALETANTTMDNVTLRAQGGRITIVNASSIGNANITILDEVALSSSTVAAITIPGLVSVPVVPGLEGQYYDMTANPPETILGPGPGGENPGTGIDVAPDGLLLMTPSATRGLGVALDFLTDGSIPAFFADAGDADQYADAFVGTITVGGPNLPAGDISFATGSDDGSVVYIDINGDGDFQDAGELVVNNNYYQGRTYRGGTVNLAAGTYDFVAAHYEGGGGDTFSAWFGPGAGLAYNSPGMKLINPSAYDQEGIWGGVDAGTAGTLLAGEYGDTGVAGAIDVNLPNLDVGGVLTLDATGGYRFVIPNAITSPLGGLRLTNGETAVGGALDVAYLEMVGGVLTRTGATDAEKDVSVTISLILNSGSLDVSLNTVPFLGATADVTIGTGQELKMVGPFVADSLIMNGTLTRVGSQGVTVANFLTTGADLSTGADMLTTAGANVTVNAGILAATNPISAANMYVNGGGVQFTNTLTTTTDLYFDGGTSTVDGAVTVGDDLRTRGGTATLGGAVTVNDELEVNNGSLTTSAPVTVNGAGGAPSLIVSGGSFNPAANVVVTPVGGAGEFDAQVSNGQVNLNSGAELQVATAELTGGGISTGTGAVVVSNNLQIGRYNFATSAGPFKAVSDPATGDNVVTNPRILITDAGSTLSVTGAITPSTSNLLSQAVGAPLEQGSYT